MTDEKVEALWRVSLKRAQGEFFQARSTYRAVAGLVVEHELDDPREDASPPIPVGGTTAICREEMHFPAALISRNDELGKFRWVNLGNRWTTVEGTVEVARAVEEFKRIAANAALALNGNDKCGEIWKTWPKQGKTWGLWTSAVFEIAWRPDDFPGSSLAAISYRWPANDDSHFGQRTCSYLPDMFSASVAAINVILAAYDGKQVANKGRAIKAGKGLTKTQEAVGKAIMLLKENPTKSDRQIAKEVDIAPSALSRSREYQALRDVMRGDGPRNGYIRRGEDDSLDVDAFD